MQWITRVAAIVIGLATTAGAATLSISSDHSTYQVGDTITLTLTGTSTSAETASYVYARVTYSAALTETVSASQSPLTTAFGMASWTQGSLATSDGAATLLNQVAGNGSPNGSGVSTSTATLVAVAAGSVFVQYIITPPSALDYFGITNSPGTSFIIINTVPEPSVTALVGLGLVGLALGRRRKE